VDIILSIDVGTTGIKVGLVDISGTVIVSAGSEYRITASQAGFAEQDPEDWWRGFVDCCSKLRQSHRHEFEQILGVGICGQMHTHVYLDQHNRIVRPAITWMDQRSIDVVNEINRDPAKKQLVFRETQNIATTTYTAPQLQWVRENQPEIWARVSHVLIAKDFIKYRLTDIMATDYSDASGTLLFDSIEKKWSKTMFEFFQIPCHLIPEAMHSDEIIGIVSEQASRLTGIKAGTPVANGSADCSTAALGAGMVDSGQVTLIIGTAGVVAVCSDQPLPDSHDRTLCWHYCLRDKWVILGITQTAGESLNWFKNAFDQTAEDSQSSVDIFEQYNNAIQKIPAGAGGLIFLPYLNGERTPYWDSAARGVYFGINLGTRKAHFIKAIMEGVSFALRNCVETVESLGLRIDQIMAVGGGLKSTNWLNTLGRIMRKPILTVSLPDTGLVGNMLICAQALGLIGSIPQAVERIVNFSQEIHYPEGHAVYEKQYRQFLALYDSLKERFQIASR
jgi:xylulokinase